MSVLSAMTIQTSVGNPLSMPILTTLAIGAAVGFVNGGLIAYLKMPAFIATLGTQLLLRGLALYISNGRPVSNLDSKFTYLGGGSIGVVPVPVIILVLLSALTWYLLKYTRLGRHIYAIGGNPQAAVVSGVNVKAVKLFTYVYAGIMAAVAGMLLTARHKIFCKHTLKIYRIVYSIKNDKNFSGTGKNTCTSKKVVIK